MTANGATAAYKWARGTIRGVTKLCLVVSLVLTACGGGPSGAKVLSFGGMFPLTGPGASIGQEQEEGAQLAVSQVNAAGGAGGYKLQLVPVDHKGVAQGGAQGMSQLVNVRHVPYVISGFASVLLAAQPIAAQHRVLLMNTGGSGTNLVGKSYLYNDAPNPGLLDPPLARYAYQHGARTAAMLYSEDAYGQENASVFSKEWKRLGGQITANDTYSIGATDFTGQLTHIKAAHPQVLFTVALGETIALVAKQSADLGINALRMNPLHTPTRAMLQIAGSALDGYIATNGYVDVNSKDPSTRAFLDAWQKKFHSQPAFSDGEAYEGVQVLAELVRRVVKSGADPNDGAALVKALEQNPVFHNYMAGGDLRILGNHDDMQPVALQQEHGLQMATVSVVQP